ncbi:uncharacterized protein [Labrus bergylta]|uniref:uncharacterized protein n=1 Tax=Labrus bergylta TaxID=56723 RepID=UPI00331408D3
MFLSLRNLNLHRSLIAGLYAKTQNIAPPQSHNNNNLGFNQDGSPHLPFMPSSWLTHPQYQTARFPTRAPYQPQHSPHTPPIYPHFHPFPLPHLASTSGHYSPGWGSLQPDYPWSLTAGAAGLPSHSEALLDQRHTEELPPERREAQHVEENADTSRSSSSQRGGGGGSRGSHLSQELDVKPVRLSSSHAESSESSRESDQVGRENRRKKKREGRSQSSSSGREAPGSQDASSSSNAIIFAAATAPQSSESDASSEKRSSRRTRRSQGLAVGSPGPEEVMKEGSSRGTRGDSGSPKEESQSIGEEVESHNEESRSEKADIPESGSQREEESVSVSVKTEKGSLKGAEKEESESSEHSSVGENVELEEEQEKDPGDGVDDVEKENGKTDEEQEERDEEDEASNVKNTTEEDDETAAEDEMEEQDCEEEAGLKNGDDGHRTQGSASSQGEDVDESERGEGKMDEDGESDEERGSEEGEDQRSDRAGEPEEGDSEDSIIAPEDNRIKKKIYVIPEAVEDEDDEGNITQSSDEDSNSFSDEDIEHLLAPQEQSNKKQAMEKSAAEKPKGNSDEVEVFHVEQCNSPKTDHQSDSDEFDHFYD